MGYGQGSVVTTESCVATLIKRVLPVRIYTSQTPNATFLLTIEMDFGQFAGFNTAHHPLCHQQFGIISHIVVDKMQQFYGCVTDFMHGHGKERSAEGYKSGL